LKLNYLIIGGDSKVGNYICDILDSKKNYFLRTSRKIQNKNTLFLDLKAPVKFKVPQNINYCFFLAGITDYKKCEKLDYAKDVNVKNTFYLIKKLIKAGIHVNFISSNTVFGGKTKKISEHDRKYPNFSYAKYKSECEDKILKWTLENRYQKLLSITRLTKVLEKNTKPLPFWRKNINDDKLIFSFYDYYFSPISIEYASKSLLKISRSKSHGLFHLSNQKSISYYDFSKLYFKKKHKLIKKKSIKEIKNIKFYYKSIYSNLMMKRTQKIINIHPESIKSLLKKLY